eukprot:15179-Heterococcus_DN1.PRE.1
MVSQSLLLPHQHYTRAATTSIRLRCLLLLLFFRYWRELVPLSVHRSTATVTGGLLLLLLLLNVTATPSRSSTAVA